DCVFPKSEWFRPENILAAFVDVLRPYIYLDLMYMKLAIGIANDWRLRVQFPPWTFLILGIVAFDAIFVQRHRFLFIFFVHCQEKNNLLFSMRDGRICYISLIRTHDFVKGFS
ncbi:MAG: hypothetical protein AAGK05_16310, partial [Pseudomonadota bacterium]